MDAWIKKQPRRECGDVDELVSRTGMGLTSPAHCSATGSNKEPPSPKDPEPFITQTSAIFQELIGGHVTGQSMKRRSRNRLVGRFMDSCIPSKEIA